MKFIILVSWKKKNILKKIVKIRFSRKKILNYAYVLKNGVGLYNIFFYFHTKLAESSFVSFSRRIRQYFYL